MCASTTRLASLIRGQSAERVAAGVARSHFFCALELELLDDAGLNHPCMDHQQNKLRIDVGAMSNRRLDPALGLERQICAVGSGERLGPYQAVADDLRCCAVGLRGGVMADGMIFEEIDSCELHWVGNEPRMNIDRV